MLFLLFDGSISTGHLALLVASITIALGFEFVNGFHDTANAVATVIYTRSLRPTQAVVWSGLCNFAGVCLGGTTVAFSIVNLLPVDLLISVGSGAGMAMVLALLIASIAWNLGTWYLALPASSSHTLIGGILGVGLANSLLPGHTPGTGVNWGKAGEVGLSLLLSPVLGFLLAGGLLLVFKVLARDPELFAPADPEKPPPRWIRGTLIATCSGVSLAHGTNDGQKGVGIIMLILIGLLPGHYALNPDFGRAEIRRTVAAIDGLRATAEGASKTLRDPRDIAAPADRLATLRDALDGLASFRDIPETERWTLRSEFLLAGKALRRLERDGALRLDDEGRARFRARLDQLEMAAEYAPTWVLLAVALALGCGTTVGWRRIVETVGEKIGKTHLSYAQGASAELVAMATIGLADAGGMPVSTTHVLASGIAGTMAANGSGVQLRTLRNIALAWVLTLPVSMFLAGALFLAFRLVAG